MRSLSVYDSVSLLGFNRFSSAEKTLAKLQNVWTKEAIMKTKQQHEAKDDMTKTEATQMGNIDALAMLLEPEDDIVEGGWSMEDEDDDIDVNHAQRITYRALKVLIESAFVLTGTVTVVKKGNVVCYAHDVKRKGKVYRKMWDNDRLCCLLIAWLVEATGVFYREFNAQGNLVHLELVPRNDIEINNYLDTLIGKLAPYGAHVATETE